MARFKVLRISNNLDDYPEAAEDSANYPELVDWVEDEYQMFIYNFATADAFPADEFFSMARDVDEFTTGDTMQRVEDELQIAIEYINSIKKQIIDARTGDGDMHEAIMSMIRDCPHINNNRILLSDEQKTYLKLKR